MSLNLFDPTRRLRWAVFAFIAVLCIIAFAVSQYAKRRSMAAQNRMDTAQAGAAQQSARDAGEAQATVNRNEVASETLGRDNEKDIRNAEGANAVVAAPVRNAGLASLCKRAAYRDREQCRLLNAR